MKQKFTAVITATTKKTFDFYFEVGDKVPETDIEKYQVLAEAQRFIEKEHNSIRPEEEELVDEYVNSLHFFGTKNP